MSKSATMTIERKSAPPAAPAAALESGQLDIDATFASMLGLSLPKFRRLLNLVRMRGQFHRVDVRNARDLFRTWILRDLGPALGEDDMDALRDPSVVSAWAQENKRIEGMDPGLRQMLVVVSEKLGANPNPAAIRMELMARFGISAAQVHNLYQNKILMTPATTAEGLEILRLNKLGELYRLATDKQ